MAWSKRKAKRLPSSMAFVGADWGCEGFWFRYSTSTGEIEAFHTYGEPAVVAPVAGEFDPNLWLRMVIATGKAHTNQL